MERNNGLTSMMLFMLILVIVNLCVLDFKLFRPDTVKLSDVATQQNLSLTPTVSSSLSKSSTSVPRVQSLSESLAGSANSYTCPVTCLDTIREATRSLALTNPAIGSPINPTQTVQNNPPAVLRESYVPMGGGSTQKNSWTDLMSSDTTIDARLYGTIQEAYFMAQLNNPTQNGIIEAQLYNVTDNNLVWNSTLTMSGPASQSLTSGKITLPAGMKLYRIRLRSGLESPASIENARIRILAY